MVPSAQGYGILMRAWPRFNEAVVSKSELRGCVKSLSFGPLEVQSACVDLPLSSAN